MEGKIAEPSQGCDKHWCHFGCAPQVWRSRGSSSQLGSRIVVGVHTLQTLMQCSVLAGGKRANV